MPIDLASVDWLYVILLALFVFVATGIGNLLSFRGRGMAALLSALFFAIMFIFWTYYPHHVPFLPRTLTVEKAPPTAAPPPAAAQPAAPVRPRNPVTDITPPKNPVTDITPPANPR
jgi:hypothetical protein